MTRDRRGTAVVTFPDELAVVITREFEAPLALVFEVLTRPEHVSRWGATPPDTMTECSIDLRVGGSYHSSFQTGDGSVCSFHGTYLEVERPTRTVATWHFDGWPDVEAVEAMELHQADALTTFTWSMAFQDRAGRDRMSNVDGQQESLDAIEDILRSLLDDQ